MMFILFLISLVFTSPCKLEEETMIECMIRTGYYNESYSYKLWDMVSVDSFPKLWEKYTKDVDTTEMRKRYFDGITNYLTFSTVGKSAFEILVGNWTQIFDDSLQSGLLMFQKHFYDKDDEKGRSGINYWAASHKTKLPMKIYVSKAVGYEFNSLKIDYDVTPNTVIEKPFIDEIRRVMKTNLFLGKMYYRVFGNPIFIIWFSLEQRL